MTKKFPFFIFLFVARLALGDVSETIVFKDHGKTVRKTTLADLKKKIPAQDIKVFEPQENKEETYQGFSMNALMTSVYGSKWKKAEEVLFTCTDGYQPSIPRSNFSERTSYMVFKKADDGKFAIDETLDHQKNVTLGPLYLVWDNLHDDELRAEGAVNWPFKVTTIDLIQFATKFPKLAPVENASSSVKLGFAHFRQYCMDCHSLNGEGGGKAPELASILTSKDDAFLEKWIDDPKSMNPSTNMPTLNPYIKGRERQKFISDIIAYLRSKV